MFCHEKDGHNVVTGWFTTKICSKCCNLSETLHNDHEIFIGSSKHKKTVNLDVTKYNPV